MQAPGQHEPNAHRGSGGPIMGARGRRIEKSAKEALEAAFSGARRKRAMHDEFYPFAAFCGTCRRVELGEP